MPISVTTAAPRAQQLGRTQTIPAPTGGLNAIDPVQAMPPGDALVLDNIFPETSDVTLRNGYSQWSTGYANPVESIFAYQSATATKLFGVSGTAVYDATAGGAIGAAVVSGLTNARWEYTNIATAGGQFLYAGNGTDKPLYYDGAAWVKVDGVSTPAITGVTTTKLRSPVIWKHRLWWVEEGSMRAWYLPVDSIGGAASSIDFGSQFRLGGQLHVIMTASLTDGSTFDDYIFFMSTQGEILMYRGTDPAFAASFNLQGVYRVGKPVGRRCWFKFGEDAVIICSDGLVSLQKTIAVGRVNQTDTISYKILRLVNQAVQTYAPNYGWQGVLHPFGNKVLINVPTVTDSRSFQFVMNTISGAWCTFGFSNTPWNAMCFEVQGDNLYFGGLTYIALADSGTADSGAVITGLIKPAFNYFGTDKQKYCTMIRPLITTDGTLVPAIVINVDYQDHAPTQQGFYLATGGTPWDTSSWDTSSWSVTETTTNVNWQTATGIGFALTSYMNITAKGVSATLSAIDYLIQDGGVL